MSTIYKTFDVALELKQTSTNAPFYVIEGDNGNKIRITVTDGGSAVDLTDCRVIAVFSKSNGTSMQDSAEAGGGVTIGGTYNNEVTVALRPASIAPGQVECELQIYSDENKTTLITTAKFNFECQRAIFNEDTAMATNEYPLLVSLISVCNGIVAAEEGRVTAEASRVSAEGERVEAEEAREAAETARVSAESSRVATEQGRETAEQSRVTAENSRQQGFAAWQNADATAITLPEGSAATATVAEVSGHKCFTFGIPTGETGPAGPSEISTDTATTLNGLLKGNGSTIQAAERGVDYVHPDDIMQSDWNQNDSTQPDYIKNRPFYTGNPVETVLVEESTVSFAPSDGVYMGELQSTFSATVGETYKVSWDRTTYESTCVNFNSFSVIGNLSIMGLGSDTGEPFLLVVSNGENIEIGTADTSASHTFSISSAVSPIVKIPAKYIDKNSSGYVVIHSKDTMTQQEAKNYMTAISTKEVVFIIWNGMCISWISFGGTTGSDLQLKFQNDELYFIEKNANGLFAFSSRKFVEASFPNRAEAGDVPTSILFNKKGVKISPSHIQVGVGTTDVLFQVQPNGTKSKAFEVLGNGEAVAPALILYTSTADSTKKFKITVDDSGEPTITDESDSTNTWKPTNLPTVTSSDSGKFLRVSDTGEWVAEIGQDGSVTDTVVTASASAWSNNTITLSVTGVMTDSKLEIGLSDTATDEQYAAATAAQIRATGSGDGTVTLKAVAAPSIDLPILIRRLS